MLLIKPSTRPMDHPFHGVRYHAIQRSCICTDNVSTERLWPFVAGLFGLSTQPPLADDDPNADYKSFENQQDAEVGYKYRATSKYTFLLHEWVQQPKVQNAWKDMIKQYSLDPTLINQLYM
jgi:hypothetical protein